ncbi:hypothetical protein CEXT_330191 [Caerostris extrusa]|uniref:Uncharacterized protein n=1 Tax=Caerostris extrusa TaxID=172846 RepID=A0AAV4SHJ9_CAEEX|nr:hypothetical protein CEXT_330191 [Caerostris extrusa]
MRMNVGLLLTEETRHPMGVREGVRADATRVSGGWFQKRCGGQTPAEPCANSSGASHCVVKSHLKALLLFAIDQTNARMTMVNMSMNNELTIEVSTTEYAGCAIGYLAMHWVLRT